MSLILRLVRQVVSWHRCRRRRKPDESVGNEGRMSMLAEPQIQPENLELMACPDRAAQLRRAIADALSWDLTDRQLCDLELLLNGAFSPLTGFLNQRDHQAVCRRMRLSSGELWPIPIVLDVTEEFAREIQIDTQIALRDPEGVALAVMRVEEVYRPDREQEA